jgi:hypothetical protein
MNDTAQQQRSIALLYKAIDASGKAVVDRTDDFDGVEDQESVVVPYGFILDNFCNATFLTAVHRIRCALPLDAKRPTVDRRFYVDQDRQIVHELERILHDALTICANNSIGRNRQCCFDFVGGAAGDFCCHNGHSFLIHCNKYLRILEYSLAGCGLPPHTDGTKVCEVTGRRSTHTLLLYLSDCAVGGETVLMDTGTQTGWSKKHQQIITVPPGKIYRPEADSRRTTRLDSTTFQSVHVVASCLGSRRHDNDQAADRACTSTSSSSNHVSLGISPKAGRIFVMPHDWPHAGAQCQSVPKLVLRAEVTILYGGAGRRKQNANQSTILCD